MFPATNEGDSMQTYLTRCQCTSTSRVTWAVIHNEMPICNDKATRREAEGAAEQMHVKPMAIWDGNTGHFYPLDTFTDATAVRQ